MKNLPTPAAPSSATNILTTAESTRLAELEPIIERGLARTDRARRLIRHCQADLLAVAEEWWQWRADRRAGR